MNNGRTQQSLLAAWLVSVVGFCAIAQAQGPIGPGAGQGPLPLSNRFARISVDKVANTFIFNGDFSGPFQVGILDLDLEQQYRGTVFRTAPLAVRDDQSLRFRMHLPFTDNVGIVSASYWFLSQDSRAIALSSLKRLNSALGIRLRREGDSLEAGIGMESNRQLGIEKSGLLAYGQAWMQVPDINDFEFTGSGRSEFVHLRDGRINADADVSTSLFRAESERESVRIDAGTRLNRRDFYTPVSQIANGIESRQELRINAAAEIRSPLSSWGTMVLSARGENGSITRAYVEPVPGVTVTSALRDLSENTALTDLRLILNGKIQGLLGLSFNLRNEENKISGRFGLAEADVKGLEDVEFQRDNMSTRSRLFADVRTPLGKTDTIAFQGEYALFRYDTPSDRNNDDRDEVFISGSLAWLREISNGLRLRVPVSFQFQHFIFLRAQRSSLNNWNNMLRFSPTVQIDRGRFRSTQAFEVLANYTIYDFEELGRDVRSFSFRQISYRDSSHLDLDHRTWFSSSVNLRYFERGQFFSGSFAELPLNSTFEFLAKLLYFQRIESPLQSGQVHCGVGARYYRLAQNNLQPAFASILPQLGQVFWGPEVQIGVVFASGNRVSLIGWYERQFSNGILVRNLPNLQLTTSLIP